MTNHRLALALTAMRSGPTSVEQLAAIADITLVEATACFAEAVDAGMAELVEPTERGCFVMTGVARDRLAARLKSLYGEYPARETR